MPKGKRGKAPAPIVSAARALRKSQTPAEKKLWAAIRNRQLSGLKFRRQHPYGSFILDAFCVEHQLEIEIDGGVHAQPERAAYDAARTEFLQQRGIHVLRFTNEDVENDLEGVLRRIVETTSPPLPTTSVPASGEGVGG